MKIPNTHSLLLQSVCWALLASLRNTIFKKTKIQKYKIKKHKNTKMKTPSHCSRWPAPSWPRCLSACPSQPPASLTLWRWPNTETNTNTNTTTNMNTKTKYNYKTCCAGWQEWPTGCAPVHQQQGQQWQEPGEEGDLAQFCHLSGQEHGDKSTTFLLTVGCPQVLQMPNSWQCNTGAQEGPKHSRPARCCPPPGSRCPCTPSPSGFLPFCTVDTKVDCFPMSCRNNL